jgi:protein-disulfide isomerase
MICLIALVVFGILGIFSATHRRYAREAFDCVFRRMTLRKCQSGFDQRMKAKITGKLMTKSPRMAGFVFKHFELISWLFTLSLFLSLGYSAYSVYNLAVFGNCEGQVYSFCAFNPETYGFLFFPPNPESIKPMSFDGAKTTGNPDAPVKVLEVGCFSCPNTRQAYPLVKELLKEYPGIYFGFKYFPLPSHPYGFELAEAAECANAQGKFWEFFDGMFSYEIQCTAQSTEIDFKGHVQSVASSIQGLDLQSFNKCVESHETKSVIEKQEQEAIDAGIYGTPTFFVNGKVLVAPKSIDEFKAIIAQESGK